ncbi:MAG: sulfatase-like hydrolase/transferase [Planctomycetaceae bacterium]
MAATDPHRDYQAGAIDPPHTSDDVIVPPIFPDTLPVREDVALYYDEISRFDDYIGKVVRKLSEQGALDETFILFISDNGRPFPRCKTTVYEDGVRTPFIVRFPPLVKAGGISQSVVSTVDIAPTILELAGLSPAAVLPDRLQGSSFAAVLRDPSQSTREFAFSEHNWHDYRAFERGVCDGRFRLVRNWLTDLPCTPPADAVRSPTYAEMQRLRQSGELTEPQRLVFDTPRRKVELYDVDRDPNCLHDLADSEEHRGDLRRLRTALDAWQVETHDEFPADALTPDRFDRETGRPIAQQRRDRPRL